ncbi:hypothetical protein GX51_07492 [Blastomyces parvus]|uniref:Uncharacterized protein n=1 Tax=Blastomyces parvus TaxID=2060905 RepID=A0A2B7WKQ6_9EURO|nr:hypothetical protein GX51_07492 [Blastomyces parvus]
MSNSDRTNRGRRAHPPPVRRTVGSATEPDQPQSQTTNTPSGHNRPATIEETDYSFGDSQEQLRSAFSTDSSSPAASTVEGSTGAHAVDNTAAGRGLDDSNTTNRTHQERVEEDRRLALTRLERGGPGAPAEERTGENFSQRVREHPEQGEQLMKSGYKAQGVRKAKKDR